MGDTWTCQSKRREIELRTMMRGLRNARPVAFRLRSVRTTRSMGSARVENAMKLEAAPGFEPACRGQLEDSAGVPAGSSGRVDSL
jgi:hypothetical protein